MNRNHLALIVAAAVSAVPVAAQTAAELLQKGIYAQETEGKLDDAIQIYRQIVNSAPNPREIGAQAQYRLAQALLQKDDTNGAAQEFARLTRDYRSIRASSANWRAKEAGEDSGSTSTTRTGSRSRRAEEGGGAA
jgi:outer membrane protein assembly factor BamD (BamD/ComL family)